MEESELEDEKPFTPGKTHDDILQMLDEIKHFEKKHQESKSDDSPVITEEPDLSVKEHEPVFLEPLKPEPSIEEPEVEWEEVDIEPELVDLEAVPTEDKLKKPGLKEKLGNLRKKIPIKFKLKPKKEVEKEEIKPEITPTTFKLRFDDEGKLVNIDLKKPKPRPKLNLKTLKKIRIRRKDKSEKEAESEEPKEKKSKISKLKGGFSKIGKLKNVIPHKKKESEETEESKPEE